MEINSDVTECEIICVIVNFGLGTKVLKIASHAGVLGGEIFLGMGTVKNRILEFLELTDIRKEIVLMQTDKSAVDTIIKSIDKEFDFKKPNHGIVFTMPLTTFLGAGKGDYFYNKSGGNIMYNSIMVVVDKGKAEFVMDSATKAGARGGTIIKARGAGIYETGKLFHMDIEPEKEIVMILSEIGNVENIVTSIRDNLEIGKTGNGIIFCLDVNKTYGLA